jgi:carboxyl-terminal processing protease
MTNLKPVKTLGHVAIIGPFMRGAGPVHSLDYSMSGFFLRKRVLAVSALSGLLFISAVFAKPALAPAPSAGGDLEPTKQQSKAARSVVSLLDDLNYDHRELDDAMSSRIFDRYFKDLDSSHSYLMATDVQGFETYRNSFDDALQKGDLKPAFAIYNRYQQRVIERLNFVLDELAKGIGKIDFKKDESLETNRDKAPWPANRAELDDLWRRRIKAAALSLRLDGKSDADIQKTLTKRYKSQLSNLVQTKPDDAFQVFMDSFTESYDPHTEYFSPRSSTNFNINMSLSLEGIGAVLQSEDEYTKVVRLVTGGPADKAKQLRPGDRIVAVAQGNDEMVDVVGWRIDEVVDLIRGAKGTTVRLEIIPADSIDEHKTKVISITRNTVKLEDQAAQKKVITITRNGHPFKIGVIKLPEFYADFAAMQAGDPNYRSTTRDVKQLINELKTENINGLVLDLRNNGGGSLQEANTLVGLFIETGPTVQVRNAAGHIDIMGDADPGVTYSGPLVCLVNRLSASATEIFAGAIQDYGRGLVVGSTTFGKGTVQSLRDLNYGQLKVTEAKFYRISGASTQHRGVVPDIAFPNIYDNSDIGESALPNALPWDTIPAATYFPYQDFSKQLPILREASRKRQAADPDFQYLNEEITFAKAQKDKTQISLNEVRRRDEQKDMDEKRLAMENRRRATKGQDLLKNWHEAEAAQDKDSEDPDPSKEKPEDQAFVTEAANVLLDSVIAEPPVTRTTPKRHEDSWWN